MRVTIVWCAVSLCALLGCGETGDSGNTADAGGGNSGAGASGGSAGSGGSAAGGGTAGAAGSAAGGSGGSGLDAGPGGSAGTAPDGGAGTAGTGGGGTCSACVAPALSWGNDGGRVAYRDSSFLDCATYRHVREDFSSPSGPPLRCEVQLACSAASGISVESVARALAHADVTAAFAQAPVLYGQDMRPVDGQVFVLTRAGRSVTVGTDCAAVRGASRSRPASKHFSSCSGRWTKNSWPSNPARRYFEQRGSETRALVRAAGPEAGEVQRRAPGRVEPGPDHVGVVVLAKRIVALAPARPFPDVDRLRR